MKRFFIAFFALIFVIEGLWIVVIPGDMMTNMVNTALSDSGLKVEFRDFSKGLFYNFKAGSIILNKSDKTLLEVDDITGGLSISSLLALRPAARFSGNIEGGQMKGEIRLMKGGVNTQIDVDKADISGMPIFMDLGINGKGYLSGELALKNDKGNIRFDVADADFSNLNFGGGVLPLGAFRKAMGAITINGQVLHIASFTMEGKGIYARVKGDVRGKSLSLTMELMPDKTFMEENPVVSLLGRYKVSPGYYVIPINSLVPF